MLVQPNFLQRLASSLRIPDLSFNAAMRCRSASQPTAATLWQAGSAPTSAGKTTALSFSLDHCHAGGGSGEVFDLIASRVLVNQSLT